MYDHCHHASSMTSNLSRVHCDIAEPLLIALVFLFRFIALCILDESLGTKIAYLVFSCPDSAPVRAKMIMSSAKVKCYNLHYSCPSTYLEVSLFKMIHYAIWNCR